MKKENEEWTRNVIINKKDLTCRCGKETNIVHCSNWHNGTGVFYCKCECGKETNVSWKEKIVANPIIKKAWSELTQEQKDSFTAQMKFAGWKDEKKYPLMTYQLKGDICYGWIDKSL